MPVLAKRLQLLAPWSHRPYPSRDPEGLINDVTELWSSLKCKGNFEQFLLKRFFPGTYLTFNQFADNSLTAVKFRIFPSFPVVLVAGLVYQ